MPKEVATVFHPRGMFVRKTLESIRWNKDDLEDFREQLSEENPEPESLFLDFFINALSMKSPVRVNWWREHAPNLAKDQWWLAALGYANAKSKENADELLLIDFYERDLDHDNCVEAIGYLTKSWAKRRLPVVLLCWSESLLRSWQQEGIGLAANREESLYARFDALDLNAFVVPVTDPMGAIVAGVEENLLSGEKPSVIVLPSFGNDKLVQANWRMKTETRIQEALEGYTE